MSKDLPDKKSYVCVAKITKPHGIKGFLKVLVYNENSNILLDKRKLVVRKKLKSVELNVEKINLESNFLLIKFFDINDRDNADVYRNYEICIPRSDFIDDNELLLSDFVDSDLYFDDTKIGSIVDVVSFSTNSLLKVVDLSSREYLIPIQRELIKFFDKKDCKLVMKEIEGILDIC